MSMTLNALSLHNNAPDFENGQLRAELVEYYRQNGFVRVRGVLSEEEALQFREAAINASNKMKNEYGGSKIFQQSVNPWRDFPAVRALSLNADIAAIAEQLAGVKLRLWHDQILIKTPHNNAATEFHQDQPYWPHADSPHPLSAWVALGDVPVERGCMTFIPGSQNLTDLKMQDLGNKTSLFGLAPSLLFDERVTVPLRAGDLTFHHGRCAHMANPNNTDVARVAQTIIFIDETTTYTGASHVVTDPIKEELRIGQVLESERFPRVDEFAQLLNG